DEGATRTGGAPVGSGPADVVTGSSSGMFSGAWRVLTAMRLFLRRMSSPVSGYADAHYASRLSECGPHASAGSTPGPADPGLLLTDALAAWQQLKWREAARPRAIREPECG